MKTNSQIRPLALVLTQSAHTRSRYARQLAGDGYRVRCFDNAWEALSIFGEGTPEVGVIGSLQSSPCLDLLMEDLRRYGVPLVLAEPYHEALVCHVPQRSSTTRQRHHA